MLSFLPYLIVGILVALTGIVLAAGYFKAPPDIAYIISGPGKKPRIFVGRAGFRVPFLKDLISLPSALCRST